MRRLLWLVWLFAVPAQAAPAEVIASAPLSSAVTVYHGDKAEGDLPQVPDRLGGYALIRETRTVSLPAGTAVVRFPGVAAGMLAESVVITGLPGTVVERNLDAALMSPRSFYAGWFGRPVTISRTDAQGRERIERAVIRSGPDGAAVIETDRGFEQVSCGPLADSLRYPSAPPNLYPTPTLSVETRSPAPVTATVTLTYLAWDYDWRADYTLVLSPDRAHGQLQAWLTLASADVTSFAHADATVVAGKPAFDETRADAAEDEFTFQCRAAALDAPPPPIVAPPPPVMATMAIPAPMMVTARMAKAMVAQVETVADLKLYRLPVPTTVAARSSKQVMLIAPRTVALQVVHAAPLDDGPAKAVALLELRAPNRKEAGLGLALPATRSVRCCGWCRVATRSCRWAPQRCRTARWESVCAGRWGRIGACGSRPGCCIDAGARRRWWQQCAMPAHGRCGSRAHFARCRNPRCMLPESGCRSTRTIRCGGSRCPRMAARACAMPSCSPTDRAVHVRLNRGR